MGTVNAGSRPTRERLEALGVRGALGRQAAAFFAQPQSADEAEERAGWERLSMEVLSRES